MVNDLHNKQGLQGLRGIPDLISMLVKQTGHLLRTESRIARAEISEKIGQTANALAMIVGGAVLLIPAVVILLQAAVAALIENGMRPSLAALIVGLVVVVLGLALTLLGRQKLSQSTLVLERTVKQFENDADMAQQQMGDRHDIHRAA